MAEITEKQEIIRLYNEKIVGKVFSDSSCLDMAFESIGFRKAASALLTEEEEEALFNVNWDLQTARICVDSAIQNLLDDNTYTLMRDINDKDYVIAECHKYYELFKNVVKNQLLVALLRRRALRDRAKLKCLHVYGTETDEYDMEYECLIRVPNDKLEES